MEARNYWRGSGPSGQDYHYYHNAETYMLTGDSLGRAMVGLISGTSGLQITSISAAGDSLWELKLTGDPDTGYEFYSSTTLDFNPGTLVVNLTQGDPGSDPGNIGGTNNSVVTTDPGGNATVQMTLTGSPANFVRATTASTTP